ncbi:DUF2975 domain-containing protein [Salininema proteolyticum]|uniref:DUF2975 domain-containing protein n=1 Tax=Salininema proteolyticum TaxID=1607685 RepID=A0ABV8TXU5_9ACTN
MGRLTVLALRTVIALAFAGSLVVQLLMIPMTAINDERAGNDLSARDVALMAIAVLALLCMQVVAVCVWRLLTMVRKGTVFSHGAFRFVHTVIAAVSTASALVLVFGALLAPGDDVPPGMVLLIGGVAVVLAGVALIVAVMRALLAQAVDLRSELDEVI